MSAIATESPVIYISPSAAEQINIVVSSQPENLGKLLRVYVEAGGCSGMQYGMTFDEARDGDLKSNMYGVTVIVDPVSADHVRGSTVDFSDALSGGGFKIVNPNARESCGCGKSFQA